MLTQAFDWRAIFIVQVPIAALGLGALLFPGPDRSAPDDDGPAHLLPDVSIGLLFGALVGALFLSVLLLIPGWSYSPIRGAAVVSALPLCSLVSRRLIRPPSDDVSVLAGERARRTRARGARPACHAAAAILPLLALAVCGTGLGLALPVLSERALAGGALQRNALVTVGARHLGLVAALALVAPVLSNTLPSAAHRAERQATAIVLDAPVGLTKRFLSRSTSARRSIAPARASCRISPRRSTLTAQAATRTSPGHVTRSSARPSHDRAGVPDVVRPLCGLRARGGGRRARGSEEARVIRLVAVFAAALVLIAAELVISSRTTSVHVAAPCGARPLFPSGGIDGTTQRIVLDGLGRAACKLGVTREELVVSLAPSER